MSVFVILSITSAFATIMMMFFEWDIFVFPLMALTILLAIAGLANPVDQSNNQTHPPKTINNARAVAVFSIFFALLPLLKPYFDELASERAEQARAKETAPLYRKFDGAVKTLEQDITTFYETHGIYPAVSQGGDLYPLIASDGSVMDMSGVNFTGTPRDPFDPDRQITIFPVGADGVLVMSVGQDGEFELPPLGTIVPIDGEPKDPLAPLAAAGLDFRTRLYDPTNGALATGDLMRFVSADETKTMEDSLAPLFEAWGKVDSLTSLPPENFNPENDIWPPPEEDAKIAEDLFVDGDYLASLAASSRAVIRRRGHANFWTTPELKRAEFNKGRALYELGHYRFAADSFNQYLIDFPNVTEGHYWLGICHHLGGDRDAAIEHLAAGFQLDPANPLSAQAQILHDELVARTPPNVPIPWVIQEQRKNINE